METEKVLCCENPTNSALMAALCGKSDNGELAAIMNNNNWMNNPFIYLVFLMMFGRNGLWGNNGESLQSSEIMSKLNAMSGQMNSNQNTNLMMDAINGNHEALHSIANTIGVSFANMQTAVCGVQNAITQVGGQVGMSSQQVINSVLLGNKDLTAALQDCCCQNKALAYEGQIRDLQNTNSITSRIDQLANGVQQGFSQIGYAAQANTNSIIQSGNANTQRIIDTMNAHWQSDLQQRYQDAKLELSQLNQNATLIAALKTTA